MVIFDTNAILRYILHDNSEMADLVEQEILSNDCLIPLEVIAEMAYVLAKVYKIERQHIAKTIDGIMQLKNISTPENAVVRHGLNLFSATNLDFVDCLLAGYAKVHNQRIFTFDKDLKKWL